MGIWCLHASSFIFDRIIIKVAGNQDRHKSSDEFDFGPLVSMAHLYVFYMFFKWDLTLAHWTQVSDRCPMGYLSKIFSKTDGPIKANMEPQCIVGTEVCSRGLCNMTKVAATPIYGKNICTVHWGSILALIGPSVLEKIFENGGRMDGLMDNGAWLHYKLTNELKGSGELKIFSRTKGPMTLWLGM